MTDVLQIPLTKGKVALVDAVDFERVAAHEWYAACTNGRWYAMRVVSASSAMRSLTLEQVLQTKRWAWHGDNWTFMPDHGPAIVYNLDDVGMKSIWVEDVVVGGKCEFLLDGWRHEDSCNCEFCRP